jgi:hypothetical protein
VRYTEWVEAVLRAVLGGADSPHMFGMPQVGTALGLKMGNWGDEDHRDLHLAIDAACQDLAEFALLAVENQWRVAPDVQGAAVPAPLPPRAVAGSPRRRSRARRGAVPGPAGRAVGGAA